MGMTMAEKILARAARKDRVKPGDFVTANIDLAMGHDITFLPAYEAMIEAGCSTVWDSNKIVVVIDHVVPAPDIQWAEIHKKTREYAQQQRIKYFYDGGIGICHQVLAEKGHALPGILIVGGDSHTPTSGALGSGACGIGISELAYVLAKGSLWFRVPETIRFLLNGTLPKGTSAQDIILEIAGRYTAEFAQYQALEFAGSTAKALSIGQRMTISNMGVEIGAKFAFFEADERTVDYLKKRTDNPIGLFGPDRDAHYSSVYEMDVSSLEPQLACPHDVDNVKPISEIGEVFIHQAFIGSCTNSRTEDLEKAARILEGKRVHSGTRLLINPASQEIFSKINESKVLDIFLRAGAMISTPGCGPCGGLHAGVLAPGEVGISSTNRNFKGRMGSPESFLYLGSPETVAASAVEGKIADPRKYLG